jgi:hypothetical protein
MFKFGIERKLAKISEDQLSRSKKQNYQQSIPPGFHPIILTIKKPTNQIEIQVQVKKKKRESQGKKCTKTTCKNLVEKCIKYDKMNIYIFFR